MKAHRKERAQFSLFTPHFLLEFLLPALLLLATGLGVGCYYETNDDQVITYLLQGRMAAAPVTNLHLYFHGLAWALAHLYRLWPQVPWYGLLLYGLLYLALVFTFAVLTRLLRPRLRAGIAAGVLTVFFLLAWVEHPMWFSYVRVPLLLAPAGLLLAAQRPAQRGVVVAGLLAFAAAWLIRPSAAVLGGVLAVPGAWWLSGRRSLGVLLAAGLLAGVGGISVSLSRSPQAAAYRRLDVLKSNLNDYQLYHPAPHTAADSLGVRAVQHWLLSDSTLVNAALFRRAAPLDVGYFLQYEAPAKAAALLRLLLRDYFPLLALLALSGWHVARVRTYEQRRSFGLVQVAYGVGLLALGVVLKLPPRIALPYLDTWLMSNAIFILCQPRRPVPRLTLPGAGLVLALLLLYGYKTAHRRQMLVVERRINTWQLQRLAAAQVPLLVSGGVEELYKSASPFGNTWALPPTVLTLVGWQSLDPSQGTLRAQLSGARGVSATIRRLARVGGAVRWVLTPAVAALLNQQLARTRPPEAPQVRLRPASTVGKKAAADQLQVYVADVERVSKSEKAKIL